MTTLTSTSFTPPSPAPISSSLPLRHRPSQERPVYRSALRFSELLHNRSSSTATATSPFSTDHSSAPASSLPDSSHPRSLADVGLEKITNALSSLTSRPPLRTSSSLASFTSDTIAETAERNTSAPEPTNDKTKRPARVSYRSSIILPKRDGTAERATSLTNPGMPHPIMPDAEENAAAANGRSANNMHQSSSRLLRMTSDGRPFIKDFYDLFATLMVSLPLTPHRVRFAKVEHTFSSEEAIANLGSLKFSQSNRMPDPKDPSRIVTTTTTTTFSMAKDMARSICQKFLDGRLIETTDGKSNTTFPLKGSVWQLSPKGICVVQVFCQRNGITQRHVLDLLESARNTMQLLFLERDPRTDALSHDRGTLEVIFRRFAGYEAPNLRSSQSISDSDSLEDYTTGLTGVKMTKERKAGDKVVENSFTGKGAMTWLMDCCSCFDRREAYDLSDSFVRLGLVWPSAEDSFYRKEHPMATHFQPTKYAIYTLTGKGQRVAGWIAHDTNVPMPDGITAKGDKAGRDSNTSRMTVILNDPALRLLFREYLRDTHCEENLTFYQEMVSFLRERKRVADDAETTREMLAAAYGLYNAFLAPGSPCELNIDHSLRSSLASRMTRSVQGDEAIAQCLEEISSLFDQAQRSVFKLMASDSVPKFLRDQKYAPILREHDFENAVASALHQIMPSADRPPSKLSK
ncbi:RGS-domain-containing protein [Xylona heveae TC161]|uniref:RGS-domain-containing protein n=1 Tax=Xylona heveae (strain CBS 132557 / TC161) TaxID=1328760 RepID=A0A165ISP0_XYLHT|nr:RGS-domain-containing protein [Xylona heveae TC161]KZF25329.1 RGS-domain-containing protein [Xylona heveae TC161]